MGLLELAHVDGDDVLLAAVEGLRQGQTGLGLAHARRPAEHEDADGLVRVVQPGAGGPDAAGDHLQGVALADDALVQGIGELEHRRDLVLDHAPHRDAGPIGDHRSHRLGVYAGEDERGLALERLELGL